MLSEVRISDVGVIASSVMELGPGFTAITGETGAGKTMVLSGLGMLRGVRLDAALVRRGASRAMAEGHFQLDESSPLAQRAIQRVRDVGGELDDGELVVTRSVAPGGRGRCAVGGCGVPAGVLREVVDQLIAVHGQNDQLRLGRSQLGLLDRWAGPELATVKAAYRELYDRAAELGRHVAKLRAEAADRTVRLDFLNYSLAQIESIRPAADEDLDLAARSQRLGHAEVLAEAVGEAAQALSDGEGSGSPDVLAVIGRCRRLIDSVRHHDPSLDGPWATLKEASALVADAAMELSEYLSGLEPDPAQLAAVEARRAELGRLTARFGPTLADVLEWERAAAAEVLSLSDADAEIEAGQAELATLREKLAPLAATLHELRGAAADRFAAAVSLELAALAMPRARVRMAVSVREDPQGLPAAIDGRQGVWAMTPSGLDDAQITLAASPDAPYRPVAEAASGGELSRIMLAIQVVLSGADPVPTMVFDEIDAGVGGAAAIEVGRRLAQLAAKCQVVVVTHLAQVAAFADRQLVVRRVGDEAVTESCVISVSGDERVAEVARMLSGQPDSETALAHARELLALAAGSGEGPLRAALAPDAAEIDLSEAAAAAVVGRGDSLVAHG